MYSLFRRLREFCLPGNWEIAGYFGDYMSAQEIIATSKPVIVLQGPTRSYYADPIVFQHEGRVAVFFEEYVHTQRKGRIIAQELDHNGCAVGPPVPIIPEPWHMSFPCLSVINGTLYLLPECAESRSIRAYPCITFPFVWGRPYILMTGIDGVDTVLIPSDETLYLVTSERGGGGVDDRGAVSVFSCSASKFPEGAWERVPVDKGAGGRNAGPPVRTPLGWIRPAQISIESYGEKISLRVITSLEPTYFADREIGVVCATEGWVTNLHTISASHGFFVIDRKRIGLRPTFKAHVGRILRLLPRSEIR